MDRRKHQERLDDRFAPQAQQPHVAAEKGGGHKWLDRVLTCLREPNGPAFIALESEADAARLVFVEVVGGDRSGAQGADARDQVVLAGGVWPAGTPVSEPGQQGVVGEVPEGLPVTGEGDAPVGRSMSSG